MSFSDEIAKINTIFIDTAPIIYYIEAHPQFGPLTKEIVDTFQSGAVNAFTSVILQLRPIHACPSQKLNQRKF